MVNEYVKERDIKLLKKKEKMRDYLEQYQALMSVIKCALWDDNPLTVKQEDYDELVKHAIISLPAMKISKFDLPEELRDQWKNAILRQMTYYARYKYTESTLPISVPYVVLKGSSAAQYYPNPELRTFGDIDIMTRREDAVVACELLLKNGFKEITSQEDLSEGRHREFIKNGIVVEIHYFFAALNDIYKAQLFDDLIVDNINSNHFLPDLINGLILIEHINQHLENGLGLRQIIDWMLFVNKCLPDEQWSKFQPLVSKIGLEYLTIITTRTCELYLGLPEHSWCKMADKKICSLFMNYIMESGNFGIKRTAADKLAYSRYKVSSHPIQTLKTLQQKGLRDWPLAHNIPLLRPFAWIWESRQYYKDLIIMRKKHQKAKTRENLLNTLGVKRRDLGMAKYKDGKYYI